MKYPIIPIIALALLVAACSKDKEDTRTQSLSTDIKEIQVPAQFSFETTTEAETQISLKDIEDRPKQGVRVSIFTHDPDFGGKLLGQGFTNSAGMAEFMLQIPAHQKEVFAKVHAVGFANSKVLPVSSTLKANFGGSPAPRLGKGTMVAPSPIAISGNYYYMGGFETGREKGLPHYLEPVRDPLSAAFLDDVNTSLPEGRPVPQYNPEYLASNAQLDVVLADKSDVWVTFVTEGAGYKNALGYYVFDSDNPPARVQDIDSIFVVLPNASLDNSGGQLAAGDKVKLGTFEAGKTISWVLFQNAWDGNGVKVNNQKWFSRSEFNNEKDPSKNQHTVQLVDYARQILVNGFEDLTRSDGGSDDDFNDLIFYVTANPWEAIDVDDIPSLKPTVDTDGDGIPDEADDFPNDPKRAIRNNYTGTLAYEDLWPYQGDYDFNDMVIDYSVDHILNGSNRLVEIEGDWTVRAVGASFHNGFGFQFNQLPGHAVAAVAGPQMTENIVNNSGNGTENGQSKATIIAFDNVFKVMRPQGKFINTIPGDAQVAPQTVNTMISFNSPVNQAQVGLPPYNAFIFVDGDRSREVHLADKAPTDLADMARLGTGDDSSLQSAERYYKTANGMPWALHITGGFNYPIEYSPINEAYLNFTNWAASGGKQNEDWYLDLPGNIDASKIY